MAENLFLLKRFKEAEAIFAELAENTLPEMGKDRFALRQAQAVYFQGDFAKAAALLAPLAVQRVEANPDQARAMLLHGDSLLQLGKYAEAAAALGRFVEGTTDEAGRVEGRFKLGLAQLRAGQVEAADKTLRTVMEIAENSPWVIRAAFEYGQSKYKQNQPDEAKAALTRVVKTAETPEEIAAPAAYLLAWIELDAKRYAEATAAFSAVAKEHAPHPLALDALFHQGVALKEAGQHEAAAAAFNAYIPKAANEGYGAKARQLLAGSLVKLGKHQEAIAALRGVVSDQSAVTEDALYDLAWSQAAVKDLKNAEASYRRLIETFPDGRLASAAKSELGELLFQRGEYAEAAKWLTQVMDDPGAESRTRAAALYRLASAREKLEDPTEAATLFLDYLKHPAKDEALVPWAHYLAGVNFTRLNRLGEAEAQLSFALREKPSDDVAGLAMLKLGEVKSQLGEYNSAAKVYADFLAKWPQHRLAGQAQFGIGWASENLKKYDAARQWYERVTANQNDVTAARAQFQIGETFFAEGNYEQAVASLLAVADVYGYPEWSARALFEAGRAFEQLKNVEQAKRQYQQVIEKYPDAPETELAKKRLAAVSR